MSDNTPTVLQLQQQIAALQDLVMALQQGQNQSSTQVAPPQVSVSSGQSKGLKVAAPDVFDGSMDKAEAFISQLALFFHGKRHELQDDSDKVILALSYMKGGTAGPWAQNKGKDFSLTGVTPSWDDFLAEFQSVFNDPDPAGTARFKLDQLSQGSMTCDEYVALFRGLMGDTGFNDAALVEKFENGLNSWLVDKIYSLPEMPHTLKDWIAWACKLDRQWRNRQTKRRVRSGASTATSETTLPRNALTTPKSTTMGMAKSPAQVVPVKTAPQVAPRVPNFSAPVPMEVDAGWKTVRRPPLVCFKCRKPGHMAINCRSTVDVRFMGARELIAYAQSELDKQEETVQVDSPPQQGDF